MSAWGEKPDADSPLPSGRPPAREVVFPDADSMVRWHEHAYPHPSARWHTHPEAELHLIRSSSGLAFVGDYVGRFSPGNLVLVGPQLPHNWISELEEGEVIPGRDVVLHVHPDRLRALAQIAPEAAVAVRLLVTAARGIEYTGDTALRGAELLVDVGESVGLNRLTRLFQLFAVLADSPSQEQRMLASSGPQATADPSVQHRVDTALAYLTEHLDDQVRLPEVAALVGMTPSAFSRFFSRTVGRGFGQMVRRLRVIRACSLLAETSMPIAQVCYAVGYGNLSNFNRQFRTETGTTPRVYRRTAVVAKAASGGAGQGQVNRPSSSFSAHRT